MSEKPYVSEALAVPDPEEEGDFTRADLKFFGIDHSGLSYQAHVFLNNPKASADTPLEQDAGYVGSFTIFGHGGCFGDVGHCDVPTGPAEPFDLRLPHPLTPASKTVIITDALRRLRDVGTTEVTVTVVPIPSETGLPTGRAGEGPVLKFDSVSLITYQ
jgi:hypothetical protein